MANYPHLDRIISEAAKLGPVRVAVAYPCSTTSIDSALTAERLGLIEPVFVGPRKRVEAIAEKQGISLARMTWIDCGEDPNEAAAAAVAMCRDGKARAIMKGSLHSDELLAAVISRDGGLKTPRRVSHAFVFDLEEYPKPLLLSDCVVNINPGLMDKRDITQNAIDLARTLGIKRPHVGILSAIETINPAIPGTLEAAVLSKMADRGQITGATVEGPLAFDIAISIEAAHIKGLVSLSPERPDILIVPNLEAGNILYKQLVYLAKAECAGIVLGTAVPIILTSRADSEKTRVASSALAVIWARRATPP